MKKMIVQQLVTTITALVAFFVVLGLTNNNGFALIAVVATAVIACCIFGVDKNESFVAFFALVLATGMTAFTAFAINVGRPISIFFNLFLDFVLVIALIVVLVIGMATDPNVSKRARIIIHSCQFLLVFLLTLYGVYK
ncbi:MAG: hypothetical protein WCV69_00415 [Patescibacteria group bacterium]|jgi:hypothetical protein